MKRSRTNALAVSQLMRARIRSGSWKPGQMIPGRRALAEEYQAALTTVERSAATLIAEGLLRVDGRRCTFVAESAVSLAQVVAPTISHGVDAVEPRRVQGTVGLISPLAPYPAEHLRRELWTARILAACENVLAEHPDLHQTFVNTAPGGRPDLTPDEAVEPLLRERVDAAVVIGEGEGHLRIIDLLGRAGVRVVSASASSSQGFSPEVCADDRVSGSLAAQHIIDRGCDRVVYLQPFDAPWSQMRLAGVREVCASVIEYPEVVARNPPGDGDAQMCSGMALAMAFLAGGLPSGTGIIAPNDAVAAAFIGAAAHRGLRPGRDFAIVGFDDRERALGLTSMRPQLEAIGEAAGHMVLRLLGGEACPPRIIIPNRLIPRTSTRCPVVEIGLGPKPSPNTGVSS